MQTLRLLQFGLILVRRLPRPVLLGLCYLFGTLAFVVRGEARQVIYANQRHVLGRVSHARLRLQAWWVLVNVFRNYYSLLRLYHLSANEIKALVELRGQAHLDAALAGGHGVILLGAHMGNYNLLAPFAALYGPPAACIVEPVQPPKLFEFVSQVRAQTGLRLLSADRTGVRDAVRLLRDNGLLAVTGDRYLGGNGADVAFFDCPAPLPHGAIVLALRSRAPLLPTSLRTLPDGRLLVEVRPPLPLVDTGRAREDLAVNMRLVAQALEETIRAAPEQWVMLNRVWPADTRGRAASPLTPTRAPRRPIVLLLLGCASVVYVALRARRRLL